MDKELFEELLRVHGDFGKLKQYRFGMLGYKFIEESIACDHEAITGAKERYVLVFRKPQS